LMNAVLCQKQQDYKLNTLWKEFLL
jgi:hypothetical protein